MKSTPSLMLHQIDDIPALVAASANPKTFDAVEGETVVATRIWGTGRGVLSCPFRCMPRRASSSSMGTFLARSFHSLKAASLMIVPPQLEGNVVQPNELLLCGLGGPARDVANELSLFFGSAGPNATRNKRRYRASRQQQCRQDLMRQRDRASRPSRC